MRHRMTASVAFIATLMILIFTAPIVDSAQAAPDDNIVTIVQTDGVDMVLKTLIPTAEVNTPGDVAPALERHRLSAKRSLLQSERETFQTIMTQTSTIKAGVMKSFDGRHRLSAKRGASATETTKAVETLRMTQTFDLTVVQRL